MYLFLHFNTTFHPPYAIHHAPRSRRSSILFHFVSFCFIASKIVLILYRMATCLGRCLSTHSVQLCWGASYLAAGFPFLFFLFIPLGIRTQLYSVLPIYLLRCACGYD